MIKYKKFIAKLIIVLLAVGSVGVPIDKNHRVRVEASTLLDISTIPVGSIVIDPNWKFQRRSGNNYTMPNAANEPVQWMVVDTNSHYKQTQYGNTTMVNHVTVVSNEVVARYNFNPFGCNYGCISPWGNMSIRNDFLRTTFYNSMSTSFQGQIVPTTTKTARSQVHFSQTSTNETIFLLSATELGFMHVHLVGEDGVAIPFFNSNTSRFATGESPMYWTRSPYFEGHDYVFGFQSNGDWIVSVANNESYGVRPALNLRADTKVQSTGITMVNATGQTVPLYYIVTNTLPALELTSPSNNQTLSEVNGRRVLTISGTVQDPDNDPVTISATVGGRVKSTVITNTSTARPWSLTWDVHSAADNIAQGTYSNIVVSANDGKGGTASATYTGTIMVDKTLPTITASPVSREEWDNTQVTIPVTVGDALAGVEDRMYQLTQSATPGSTWSTAPSNSFNVTVNTEGEWYLHVRVTDRAGNERTTTYGIYRYFVLHQPENVEVSATTTRTMTVRWNMAEGHSYLVRLRDDQGNIVQTVNWGATAPVVFTGLTPNTQYIPEVQSRKHGKSSTFEAGNARYTDAAPVTKATFEPLDEAIKITLDTEATGNPAYTQYEIRNVPLNISSPAIAKEWTNTGLQNDMYYQYMARPIHRNGKEGVWYFIGEGHTILTIIEPPVGWEDEVGGIVPINLPGGFDPNNMHGKVVEFDGKKAIVVVGRNLQLSAENVQNAKQYSISLNGYGYSDWKDLDSNGSFTENIFINQPGFYPVHLKFKNQYGRESEAFIRNYLIDWIAPETSSVTKIKGQTATTTGTLTIKATGKDNLSPMLYNAGSGWQWFTSGQDITITGIPLNNQRHNATVRFSDLNGNVVEEVHRVWGISN